MAWLLGDWLVGQMAVLVDAGVRKPPSFDGTTGQSRSGCGLVGRTGGSIGWGGGLTLRRWRERRRSVPRSGVTTAAGHWIQLFHDNLAAESGIGVFNRIEC